MSIEIGFLHLVEEHIAQIAGIVDNDIDPPERVEGRLYHRLRVIPRSHAAAVGDRPPSGGADFVHDVFGGGKVRRTSAGKRVSAG